MATIVDGRDRPPAAAQRGDGRVEHPFEKAMFVLALLVIPVMLVEETSSPKALRAAAVVANWVIWLGFVAELALVAVVASRRRAALRAHWLELLIVVVTPPFLPSLLGAFRLARLLRLLRLVRLGAVGGRALRSAHVFTTRQGFRYVALLTLLLVVVAGAAISAVDAGEFPNVWRGIWWAVVTVTTVGYGDYTPHTVPGRVVAVVLMFVGIGFLSLLTATIASAFVSHDVDADEEGRSREHRELMDALRRIEARLDALERD